MLSVKYAQDVSNEESLEPTVCRPRDDGVDRDLTDVLEKIAAIVADFHSESMKVTVRLKTNKLRFVVKFFRNEKNAKFLESKVEDTIRVGTAKFIHLFFRPKKRLIHRLKEDT